MQEGLENREMTIDKTYAQREDLLATGRWGQNGEGPLFLTYNRGITTDELTTGYRRYEYLRTLNPREFKELWEKNIRGQAPFDRLVDEGIRDRLNSISAA